jgi:uncharacterized protein (TIGR00251 family)
MTANRKFEITDARGGAALNVRVVTQSDKTELVGIQSDGAVKIRLMASPAGDPAANRELLEFLSRLFNVPTTSMEIVAGEGGRDKIISIEGVSIDQLEQVLNPPQA